MALTNLLLISSLAVLLGTLSTIKVLLLVVSAYLATAALTVIIKPSFKRLMLMLLIPGAFYCYGSLWVQNAISHRLPLADDKLELVLTATVLEAQKQERFQRLMLTDITVQSSEKLPDLRKIRLNLYQAEDDLRLGARVKVKAVLRSPYSLMNGLAFDYEGWLLNKKIDALGYIKEFEILEQSEARSYRQQMLTQVKENSEPEQWPWLAGLIFGEQDAFNTEQWRLAKATGTLHLLVVSGMHLGLVALLSLIVWGGFMRGYALIFRRNLNNLVIWRTAFLFITSAVYLWIAGAGIALQRAWIMLVVVLLILNVRHHINWHIGIALALLIVLLINPLVWLSAGFGYSFVAVLSLLLFFYQRQNQLLEGLWLPQWVVFLGLLPLFLYWQQPVALNQLLANLVAIPFLSFVLMPLTMAVLLLPEVGQSFILTLAGEFFWSRLAQVNSVSLPQIVSLSNSVLFLWCFWLLTLRMGVGYWLSRLALGAVVGAIFFIPAQSTPSAIMMDVGQGQSVAFITSRGSLVYDAGPAMGGFDSGENIVTPVLQKMGVKKIDALIISHQDNDHAGGTNALLNNFSVFEWLGGEELKNSPSGMNLCKNLSPKWEVINANLRFRVFNIDSSAWEYLPDNHNNRSCVVQVFWYGQKFLLVGDIAKPIEYELIRKFSEQLRSDVLVISHHGSATSSSQVFLETVAPQMVWISAGFNNQFNHPAEEVVQRLDSLKIHWLNTANEGQIWFEPNQQVQTIRRLWQPPWRNK